MGWGEAQMRNTFNRGGHSPLLGNIGLSTQDWQQQAEITLISFHPIPPTRWSYCLSAHLNHWLLSKQRVAWLMT